MTDYSVTPVPTAIVNAFAPEGTLRASINFGNPLLANVDASGQPFGVSVDLARALAQRLGVDIELIVFNTAGKSVDAVIEQQADVGFFAIDPLRAAEIAFTAPYLLIEGFYLVREDSAIVDNAQVDVASNRVVVGVGSTYDLYLTRTLQNAAMIRAASSQVVVDTFIEQNMEVAAGVKQQMQADARRVGGLRLLDERFMIIRQAMGLQKRRGKDAEAFLHRFVEEMKSSGFIQSALERHGIADVTIAPAESPAA